MRESNTPSFRVAVHNTIENRRCLANSFDTRDKLRYEYLLQPYKDVGYGPTSMRSTALTNTNLAVTG